MKKDNGLTLIEVLASVVVLAVVILVITMVLQQTASSSRSNAVTDKSVQLSRTLLEEVKNNLKNGTVSVFSQNVSIQALRDNSSPQTITVYYPNSGDQQYRLDIQSLTIPNANIELLGKPHNLNDTFRRVKVTCTNLHTNRSYELEALVEYK